MNYRYECDNCGHKQKIKQSITDKAIEKCPKCNTNNFYRVIGNVDYIAKCRGFYGKGN